MPGGAQLSVTDQRCAARRPVDYPVIGEHRRFGDMTMRIVNISTQGFMINDADRIARGDRVMIRLPHVGQIEAHAIWIAGQRAGFQFERLIRQDEFSRMISTLQPNARLRAER